MEFVVCAAALPLSAGINYLLYRVWNAGKIDALRSLVKSDRWGSRRVPLTGGIVIAVLFFSGALIGRLFAGIPRELAVALAGSSAMFVPRRSAVSGVMLSRRIMLISAWLQAVGQELVTSPHAQPGPQASRI